MTKINTTAYRVGAAGLALAIASLAAPAFAQDAAAPADAAPADAGQTIVVTGSRIASPNLTSTAPITSLTSEDIKLQGTTKTEDLLNSLPQVFAAQSSTLANGATGTATVDLRGLGASRTLVLVNGRRLMPGDVTSSAADLNFVPASLVKRVDVLTGGASATYGADAVAGVVNFVLDTEFTGLRVDANYGFYQHNNRNSVTPSLLDKRTNQGLSGYGYPRGSVADGGNFDTTISFGTKFADGQGHAMAYFGYRKVNPILQSKRDYSSCTVQNANKTTLQCGGSATSATGNILFTPAGSSSSTFGALGPGTLTPNSSTRYNFAPLNYFQRPDERYTAGAFVDYEVNSAIHPYMEFMFMDDRTVAQIAPSGDFGNTLTINCDNPMMSASQKAQICNPSNLIVGYVGNYPLTPAAYTNVYGTPAPAAINKIDPTTGAPYNLAYMQLLRRNVEGGPRQSDLEHQAFRTLIGSRGELGKGWSYDAYYQYGRVNYSQIYTNEFSAARLTNALDAVTNPATGQTVCRSVLTGGDPNCVPYNVFSGQISPAALNYLNASGFQRGHTTEQVLSGQLTGDLGQMGIKSPLASDGISIALGVEHRRESLDLKTDNEFQTGDLTGQGAPTLSVSGSYKVTEFISEAEVPLVQDGFIYNLSLNLGYRYSHYSVSNGQVFNTNTWKIGADFAPVRDLRIRGSVNRAVRAPNIQELFSPNYVGLDGSTDPCADKVLTAADQGCLLQGLKVGQKVVSNPAGQYNGYLGGNGQLRPEVATTKTVGVILQPSFVPGFSFSVDYFDIKLKKAIQGYGADAILAACTTDLNLTACGLIHRNAAGSLWLTSDGYVTDTPVNVGGVTTKGFEFNGNYAHALGGLGRGTISFVATYLDKYVVDNGLTALYDCAGYYGVTCGSPRPVWRHKLRVGLDTKAGFNVSVQWRYFDSVDVEYKNPSSTLAGNYRDFNSHIPTQSYFDLAVSTRIQGKATLRFGVNNIFDRDPPLVTSGPTGNACASVYCNGNTYPGTYDSLGRYLYSSITLDF